MTPTPASTAAEHRRQGLFARGSVAAFVVAALVTAGAFGCAPSGYYRSSQSSLDSLVTTQNQLLKRMDNLDRKVESTSESVRATRASNEARMNDLSGRLDVIEGKINESGERFSKIGDKIDTVRERLNRADSTRTYGSTSRDSTAVLDPESAYNAAYADLSAGRYDLARQAFGEYLRHYPDTERSDNAQYWVGECLYATGKFDEAIEEYSKVVSRYPKGDKVASALLKTGYAHAKMDRQDEAKKFYRLVIQRFPKSDEARLAKERLAAKS